MSARLVISKNVHVLGMLLFLIVFLGALEIASPLYFLRDDNSTFFLPAYVHNYRVLVTHGELAQVNFHQYMGLPHLAAGQPATLYAPVYLAVAVATTVCGDVRYTIDLLVITHLLVAGVGMFVLARYCKLSPLHSALLGIAWATFPFTIVVARGWVFVSYLAAYLPLNLWLVLRLADAPYRLGRIVALAALKSVFVTTGYLQYFVLSSLFEGVFLAIRWFVCREFKSRRWGEMAAMAGTTVLVCGLSAPLILPAFQAKSLSKERGAPLPLQEVLNNSMTWTGFLRAQALCPPPRSIFNASGSIFFIGLPVLATAGWLLLTGHKAQLPLVRSCAWVGVAAVVFSSAFYGLLCFNSLMATFRWPFKSFIFAGFYLLLAATMTWKQWKRPIDWAVAGLAVTTLCHMFLLSSHEHRRAFADFQIPCSVKSLQDTLAYRYATGVDRVATVAPEPVGGKENEAAMQSGHWAMAFNYATLGGKYHFAGYDPIVPSRQSQAALKLNYSAQIEQPITTELIEYLGSWTVRWLVVPSGSANAHALADLNEVAFMEDDGRIAIFENLRCSPLATVRISGLQQEVPITVSMAGNSLQLDVDGMSGVVTVNCVYHPAYELIADGKHLESLHETDDHRLQFPATDGMQQITIRFSDSLFVRGLELAASTCVLITLLLFLKDFRHFWRSHRTQATAALPNPAELHSTP